MNAKQILDRIERVEMMGNGTYRLFVSYRNTIVRVIAHSLLYDAYTTLRHADSLCLTREELNDAKGEMQNLWRKAGDEYRAQH